jgi:hypothetical protein
LEEDWGEGVFYSLAFEVILQRGKTQLCNTAFVLDLKELFLDVCQDALDECV